jgi:hypothetical protein
MLTFILSKFTLSYQIITGISLCLLVILPFGLYSQGVVINEIMFDPISPEPEWIELHNPSSSSVTLTSFYIAKRTGRVLIPTVIIPSGGFAVLVRDSLALVSKRSISANVIVARMSLPTLNNTTDSLILQTKDSLIIDSFVYDGRWGSKGISLERVRSTEPANNPTNIKESIVPDSATCGFVNSVAPSDIDIAISSVVYDSTEKRFVCWVKNVGNNEVSDIVVRCSTSQTELYVGNISLLRSGDSVQRSFSFDTLIQLVTTPSKTILYWSCKAQGDTRSQNDTSSFTTFVPYKVGSIIINEVMYDPTAPEPDWIELWNTTQQDIPIANLYLSKRSSRVLIPSFTLPQSGYAVLVRDSLQLRNSRVIPVECVVVRMSLPTLNNTADSIALTTNDSISIDAFSYSSDWGIEGYSLERAKSDLPANSQENIKRSIMPDSASCGFFNSISPLPFDASISTSGLDTSRMDLFCTVINTGKNSISNIIVQCQSTSGTKLYEQEVEFLNAGDSSIVSFSLDSLTRLIKTPGTIRLLWRVILRGDQRILNDSSWMTTFIPFPLHVVLINEILFDPGGNGKGEFVEFYNTSDDSINIKDLVIQDASTSRIVIQTPLIIAPKSYSVVITDSAFYKLYPSLDGSENIYYFKSSLSLSNTSDVVKLRDPLGRIVDSLRYDNSWHSPSATITKGKSLEKLSPLLPSINSSSWTTCVADSGATPASINSVSRELPSGGTLQAVPNPFSPRSQRGDKRTTVINFRLPYQQARLTAAIYDLNGLKVMTIANGQFTGSEGTLSWDGTNTEQFPLGSGAYILHLEASDTKTNAVYADRLMIVIGE